MFNLFLKAGNILAPMPPAEARAAEDEGTAAPVAAAPSLLGNLAQYVAPDPTAAAAAAGAPKRRYASFGLEDSPPIPPQEFSFAAADAAAPEAASPPPAAAAPPAGSEALTAPPRFDLHAAPDPHLNLRLNDAGDGPEAATAPPTPETAPAPPPPPVPPPPPAPPPPPLASPPRPTAWVQGTSQLSPRRAMFPPSGTTPTALQRSPPRPAATPPRPRSPVRFRPAPATPPRSPMRFRPGSAWSERDDARKRQQKRLSTGSDASAVSVEKVLEACEETARAVASPNAEGRRIQRLFDDVCGVRKGTKALEALEARLQGDETLLRARATRCGPKVYDGASVLHAAAFHGQVHVIEAVLKVEESPLDPWTLDTAGRTALHVAAERGHVACCDLLRKAMSKMQDPVGANAPADLSGRTPCAWAAERVKDAQKRDALEASLFSPGDATVLPRRVESSRASHSVTATAGWRVTMEDAHAVCKVDDATLYAVFDGHGGSLVANCSAAHIERCLKENWSDDGAATLKAALAGLDAELAAHPRLVKSRRSGRGNTGPLIAEDESGATATLCLVTTSDVVVAHLGDSSAFLLKKNQGAWTATNLTPTDHTAAAPSEAARIDALAGFGVLKRENDAVRVAKRVDGEIVENGALQTTRALGDFAFKTETEAAVSSAADACVVPLAECCGGERACVLIACDGVWDVLTGVECGAILDAEVEGLDAQCDAIVAESVRRKSRDNVTAILVDLDASRAARALAFGAP